MNVHDAQSGTEPSIGVLIPTYNRRENLLTCLQHLEAQTWRDFQVVVVDDGSTDGTWAALAEYERRAPFRLCCLRQENGGPAHARNLGIAVLESAVCVMIGDDTFPQPDFVATHARFHAEHPAVGEAAVGLTVWSERGQVVTPLMRWLGSEGVQFAYRELLEGELASWKHFYTSNLSVKTTLLKEHAFDEGFPTYGMEDIELGYRLEKLGLLQMTFLPSAVVEHLHPTTFEQTCRRAVNVGAATRRFEELWPELAVSRARGIKGWALHILSKRAMLTGFSLAARCVTAMRCPNPLLRRAIQLHEFAGYSAAAGRTAVRK